MTFEEVYSGKVYNYLDSEFCEEECSHLIPFLRSTLMNKRAYKKAHMYLEQAFSTEFADNVVQMVSDSTIGICEPEQYVDTKEIYSTYVNVDVFHRMQSAVDSYEIPQLMSLHTFNAFISRLVVEKMNEGRTDIRLDYLIESLALACKGFKARNRQVVPKLRISSDLVTRNIQKAIGNLIDTLSTSKGKFNTLSIVVRDKFDWEDKRSHFTVHLCDTLQITYQEYLRTLKTFLRIFNRRVKSGMLNYPKLYIMAKVKSRAFEEIHDILYKHSLSDYTYSEVSMALNSIGINITYSGVHVAEVREKIKNILLLSEFVEEDEIDEIMDRVYDHLSKVEDSLVFADEDLEYVLQQTTDSLTFPNHCIERVYYPRMYGFCNWQNILSVSYVNFKSITRYCTREYSYEVMRDKLQEAVINAQMLNYAKKFWTVTTIDTTYKNNVVAIQYVPKKYIPMVADIVENVLVNMQKTYQCKFDFVIQDDRNFAYIESNIKRLKKKQEEVDNG